MTNIVKYTDSKISRLIIHVETLNVFTLKQHFFHTVTVSILSHSMMMRIQTDQTDVGFHPSVYLVLSARKYLTAQSFFNKL